MGAAGRGRGPSVQATAFTAISLEKKLTREVTLTKVGDPCRGTAGPDTLDACDPPGSV
jgi:hypothetical protein